MAKWGFVGGNVRESEQCGGVVKEVFVFVFQRFKDYPSLSLSLSLSRAKLSVSLKLYHVGYVLFLHMYL
jgi:hypothetical protein